MKNFAKRNILIYFRDRSAIVFSMLGVIIVVAIYALFLGDNLASGLSMLPDAGLAVSSWLVAGLCAITPVSTALGAMGALITDRAAGVDRDFLASPVPRYKLVGGYLAGGLVASGIISFLLLGLGSVWLGVSGAALPGLSTLLAVLGVQLLSVLNGGAMVFLLVSFFHTNASYSAVSTAVGAILGFLTGIYLPIGSLPAPVQWVIKLFPTSHSAALMRYLILEGPGQASMEGIPAPILEEIYLELGVRFEFGDALFPLWGSVLVLAGSALLFFALSVASYARQKK